MLIQLNGYQHNITDLIECLEEYFGATYRDQANLNFKHLHLYLPNGSGMLYYLESRTPTGELWISLNMPPHAVLIKP